MLSNAIAVILAAINKISLQNQSLTVDAIQYSAKYVGIST